MPTFAFRRPSTHIETRGEQVADRYEIRDGFLVFYVEVPHKIPSDRAVRTVAPGEWTEVWKIV